MISALRAVRERNRRRKERSPYAARSVIKLSIESSERFAFRGNRDMGCQDGTRSVRLRNFLFAGLVFGVCQRRESEEISASISVRWKPDRIFAYHRTIGGVGHLRSDWIRKDGTRFLASSSQ